MFKNPFMFGVLNLLLIAPVYIFIINNIRQKEKINNEKPSYTTDLIVLCSIVFFVCSLTSHLIYSEKIIEATESFKTGGAPF